MHTSASAYLPAFGAEPGMVSGMVQTKTPLDALAEAAGVMTSYKDVFGENHSAPDATVRAILTALGFDVSSDDRTQQSLEAIRSRTFARVLEPFYALRAGDDVRIELVLPSDTVCDSIEWSLTSEDGAVKHGAVDVAKSRLEELLHAGDDAYRRIGVELCPALSEGYYDLDVRIDARLYAARVIVAPPSCYIPPAMESRGIWGVAAQVYALRSERRAYAGDFRDLRALCEIVRDAGGGAVGVNPLHLLPQGAESPYGPSSRAFLNWTYLDCAALPGYAAVRISEEAAGEENDRLVDYGALYASKLRIARGCFERFTSERSEDRDRFESYVRAAGEALQHSSIFQALADRFRKGPGDEDWRTWPAEFRNPQSPAVEAFAREAQRDVTFYSYLQWQCDEQLARVADACGKMPIGIYRDIAVGTQLGGCDTWLGNGALLHDVAVGAPPDMLNRSGQDWGVAPFDPLALREAGYRPFAELIRANARHAGALRIDHVMGLVRLWWVPGGVAAADGAYVSYRLDEMLAVLALESRRARCLIVGEDLGTVPPGFRERLAEYDVLSYRILQFEHDDERFFAPDDYPENALVAIGTHDLPPMAAYWSGGDIDTRARIGTLAKDDVAAERDDRARKRELLAKAFAAANDGVTAHETVMDERIELVAHDYLAKTPARLLLASLEDVLGASEQINMPATTNQYPNWRHRSDVTVEALRTDERFIALADALRERRGSQI